MLAPQQQRLIEALVDNELDEVTASDVRALLAEDARAAAYHEAIISAAALVRDDIEAAADRVDFASLDARVSGALDASPQRDPYVEGLAVAWIDGETLTRSERATLDAYLAETPAAREGVDALRALGDWIRLPVEMAADSTDFSALNLRIESALDAVEAERRTPQMERDIDTPWQQVRSWWQDMRGALMGAALAAAAVAAILLPQTRQAPAEAPTPAVAEAAPTVINNYYTVVDSLEYEPGHWGSFTPGSDEADLAPVIWIAPQPAADSQPSEDADGSGGIPL